jgi:hypothetical protein
MTIKLRAKLVEIEAVLWDGTLESVEEIECFAGASNVYFERNHPLDVGKLELWNYLEDQWIKCPIGHYVLKGLKNEFYPCEPEALNMKYDIIDDKN